MVHDTATATAMEFNQIFHPFLSFAKISINTPRRDLGEHKRVGAFVANDDGS